MSAGLALPGLAPTLAALGLTLAACAPQSHRAMGKAPGDALGNPMTATRLYFGMSMPGGGRVSEAAWRDFLAREVTPRFPDGLTVLEARGQWRDRGSGRILRERSRVLLLLHRGTAKAKSAIAAIIARYKARFRQQSVLRVDTPVRVQF
jgi:hypothetical protein